MSLTILLLGAAAFWIAANLSYMAFIGLVYRFRRESVRRELPRKTPAETVDSLVRQLHNDIEKHGPGWFTQRRDTRYK